MNITLWKILLIIATVGIFFVIYYRNRKGSLSMFVKITFFILIVIMLALGYQSYRWYNKKYNRPILKELKTDYARTPLLSIPIEENPFIREYLTEVDKDRPVIIAFSQPLQIRFTDPLSPNSPHAIISTIFENKGYMRALDMHIEWNITDRGRRITSPNEWNKIIGKKEIELPILNANQHLIYVYGPEIGAYASSEPPEIELMFKVSYKDEKGKEYEKSFKFKSNPKPNPDDSYNFDILGIE